MGMDAYTLAAAFAFILLLFVFVVCVYLFPTEDANAGRAGTEGFQLLSSSRHLA